VQDSASAKEIRRLKEKVEDMATEMNTEFCHVHFPTAELPIIIAD
jgi:hypothetical protein